MSSGASGTPTRSRTYADHSGALMPIIAAVASSGHGRPCPAASARRPPSQADSESSSSPSRSNTTARIKRGIEESNLALRFWRPPCYRYTNPPGRRVILGAPGDRRRSAEQAQLGQRPDERVHPGDERRFGYGPEHARVHRVAAAIAEHEDRVALDADRAEVLAVDERRVLDVGLRHPPAVDHQRAVLDPDLVAGKGDHALEQQLAGSRGVEDHEVSALRIAEPVGELVREDVLAGLEGRHHAARGDL